MFSLRSILLPKNSSLHQRLLTLMSLLPQSSNSIPMQILMLRKKLLMMPHQVFRVSNLSRSSPNRASRNLPHSLNLSNPNSRLLSSNSCLLLITRKTNNLITSFLLNLNTNMQILLHLNHSIHLKFSSNNSTKVPVLSLNNNSNSRRSSNRLLRNMNRGAEKSD
jgi:hypothetical protein